MTREYSPNSWPDSQGATKLGCFSLGPERGLVGRSRFFLSRPRGVGLFLLTGDLALRRFVRASSLSA
jgi:hypothetical protein